MGWAEAGQIQRRAVEQRQRGTIPDQLFFVEHPHTVTLGRNAKAANVLASPSVLERSGIAVFEANRGGDVTYHGPGQVVGYPILDLNGWRRDVHAYVRAIEETVIRALAVFGIAGGRSDVNSGVWVSTAGGLAKICAIGIHISRWVTSHGFALNVTTDLNYFRYIVPCGLPQPVASFASLGVSARRGEVLDALAGSFGEVFGREMKIPVFQK
jgi:lipoyl(octanoyl) transferase